ncbi:TPA: mini-MOMP protein [Campylobacter jejuni]|nr:mini-MOMP protein [Campylobacter jejuni]HEF1397074.1 mini-MOMP protein [Campylobacter jejuni]HEF3068636.1 mini-MOMP protein [Campylobacter jejuni]HEF4230096.1 mini-MOMP protein [Campylobacter jejuni]HEF7448557.1 mini-MOMP protein [Campylobacter jejuni]
MKKIFLIGMILNHFVFAAPLDEVFKDIEVSGTVRYRYDIKKEKKYNKKTHRYIDIKIKHKQKLQ